MPDQPEVGVTRMIADPQKVWEFLEKMKPGDMALLELTSHVPDGWWTPIAYRIVDERDTAKGILMLTPDPKNVRRMHIVCGDDMIAQVLDSESGPPQA